MDNSDQLVIYSNKANNKITLIILPTLIFVLTIGLNILFNINYDLFRDGFWGDLSNKIFYFIILSSKVFVSLIILFFFIGFLFTLFEFLSNKPIMILNSKGILFKYYCFVSWDNILEIRPYYMGAGEALGIRVKNLDILFRNSKFSGKVAIFWSKIFGYHHINISNITVFNEEIILFARKYIKHKGIIHE